REDAIVQISREDSETRLANRRAMDDDLKAYLSVHGDSAARIAVIRVKRFGSMRAAIGHQAAAQAVEVLAARIGEFNEGAVPYRISPTDIGLILPAASPFARIESLRR